MPWNGDAPLWSGPPTDVFIIPAVVDLAVYIALCAWVWSRVYRRLELRTGARVSIVAFAWLYAVVAVSFKSLGVLGLGGAWRLWYDISYYGALLGIGLTI